MRLLLILLSFNIFAQEKISKQEINNLIDESKSYYYNDIQNIDLVAFEENNTIPTNFLCFDYHIMINYSKLSNYSKSDVQAIIWKDLKKCLKN